MIKNKISIERQINERQYQFIVSSDSSLDEIISILKDMQLQIEQIKQNQKQKEDKDVQS